MLESQFDSGKLFANKECDLENTFLFVKSAIELLGDDLSNLSIRRFEYLYSLINEAINPFESHIQDYKESVTTEDRVIDNLIDKEVKDMINEKVLSRLKTDIEKEIYDTIYNNGCITRDELMEKYNVNKTKYNNYAGRVSRVLLDVASKIKINNPEYIPEYISMPKQKRR